MNNVQVYEDPTQLAQAAAKQTIAILASAIHNNGHATWVLAGGSAPQATYKIIASQYLTALDWAKVTIIIGDERIGPLASPNNNWHAITTLFLSHIPQATFIRPHSQLPVQEAASDYQTKVAALPQFDLVWLGMGEDGHTLSLFPGHTSSLASQQLVIPVHNSPKPPPQRISLTLHALKKAKATLILASGNTKAAAVAQAFMPGSTLPIAQAAATTHAIWLLDTAAASQISVPHPE